MDLVFQNSPEVQIGTLTFRNVPTILQFEDVPLISVGDVESAGYSTHFHIFHPDGTPLAVVKGARMFLTEEGEKANLNLRHLPGVVACELSGQTLFELRHAGASALKASAELYTPTGILIKAADSFECLMPEQGGYIRVGGVGIRNAVFENWPFGIKVRKNGGIEMRVLVSQTPGGEMLDIQGLGKFITRRADQSGCEIEVHTAAGMTMKIEEMPPGFVPPPPH